MGSDMKKIITKAKEFDLELMYLAPSAKTEELPSSRVIRTRDKVTLYARPFLTIFLEFIVKGTIVD